MRTSEATSGHLETEGSSSVGLMQQWWSWVEVVVPAGLEDDPRMGKSSTFFATFETSRNARWTSTVSGFSGVFGILGWNRLIRRIPRVLLGLWRFHRK